MSDTKPEPQDRKTAVTSAQCWYDAAMDFEDTTESDRWHGWFNAFNHTENALFAAREKIEEQDREIINLRKNLFPINRGYPILGEAVLVWRYSNGLSWDETFAKNLKITVADLRRLESGEDLKSEKTMPNLTKWLFRE